MNSAYSEVRSMDGSRGLLGAIIVRFAFSVGV
jgi:hypothetical protein